MLFNWWVKIFLPAGFGNFCEVVLINATKTSFRYFSYFAVVALMGNFSMLVDYFLNPDLPSYNQSHIVIGGVMSLLAAILCLILESHIRRTQKKTFSSNQFGLYVCLLASIWTAIILFSLTWNIVRQKQNTMEVALNEARTVFEKDLNYYRWATEHEGVFVPVTSRTQPNPYLSHMPEYIINTVGGAQLTLVNPEYMIRQVYELQTTRYGALGHITSLDPMRQENAADPWETEALISFEAGATEISSMEKINGEQYFRLMRPMVTEDGCLRCHAAQGYAEGDIRGGISVSVPMAPLLAINRGAIFMLALAHGVLWSLGLLGVFAGSYRMKEAIREREQAEARTAAIIDNMLDGLITLDENGTIESLNAAASGIFGYGSEEVVGRNIDVLVKLSTLEQTGEIIQSNLHLDIREAMGGQRELIGRRKDAITFPLEMSLSEMWIGPKHLVIATVRDLTNEKIRKAEALRAGQLAAIGELAAGVAHEINNPINGIINYTQILMDMAESELDRDPEREEIMGRIIKEGDRIAVIVRNLLNFARQHDEVEQEVRIDAVLKDSISLLSYQIQKAGINIKVNMPADLPTIQGNPQQLRQVFLNLLSNSVYALNLRYQGQNKGKNLEIASSLVSLAGKDFIRTEVIDWGGGIPEDVLDRVFDPLFSTKPSGKGTGLGLSISQGLVREHHGYLRLESVAGEKTTATVDLPLG
jgi:PAS domain S-box-containing protein